ncbi:UDP-xylose and UDP-N-acetylglucosamine transporter-like [Saccoglossus kowalevskii]|uniref:UDP-xylose and UDP-N-acetylglucosamine transporter-like n=1 Tax=Saccoglossus kowalevskii TaxID=10224 RepID=A0ABM0MLB4_SACKO|nr:PREDICTED: UDP-xylose and UDP-N-acetylglucosamine transporter-like [Saccoglossus kowalevskii]
MLQPYAIFAVCLVFVGCAVNVVFLELIIRDFPGSGNIITFFQFLFIAIEGFIDYYKFGKTKPVIPIKHYGMMVTLFFLVSVVNNYALNFNIPLPLHMIFRAGSLIANMVLGIIILKRKYKYSKYIAVIMITVGISSCTIASAKQVGKADIDVETEVSMNDFFMLVIGILMLCFALFMSARMGIFQEVLYKRFGKQPKEALFYSHALPLPVFLLLAPDIYNHIVLFSQTGRFTISPIFGIPEMWLYLLGNCITQYVCISGVFILTTECPSLVVTLVITLRKFFSLMFSVLYFKNPFTVAHWFGTFLVFAGTFMFIDMLDICKRTFYSTQAKKA